MPAWPHRNSGWDSGSEFGYQISTRPVPDLARMDGGEILGRNASMASQESRIGGFPQLVVSGAAQFRFFHEKSTFSGFLVIFRVKKN